MSVRLPRRVGVSRAKELMFTSRRINGRTAADIGLVDYCFADDALDAAVLRLGEEIVANSSGSNRIAKALVAGAQERTWHDALQYERAMPFGMPDDMATRMAAASPQAGKKPSIDK
jgi:enoyl-CoA hydratase/carnithine racemase